MNVAWLLSYGIFFLIHFLVKGYNNWSQLSGQLYLGMGTWRRIPKHLPKFLLFWEGSLSFLPWHGLPVFIFVGGKKMYLFICLTWQILGLGVFFLCPLAFICLQPCWQHINSSASCSPSSYFCIIIGTACKTGSYTILHASGTGDSYSYYHHYHRAKGIPNCWVTSLWGSSWSISWINMKGSNASLGLNFPLHFLTGASGKNWQCGTNWLTFSIQGATYSVFKLI